MWDRGKKKTPTIRRKTKISHHHPLCHSPMVKVLGNSSKAGSQDSVVNATLDCWPLIVMYYQTRATRKQPWSFWCQELSEIEHAESQKSGKWVPSEIVMGWSDTMPPLCTQEAMSGAEIGNGALGIHGTAGERKWADLSDSICYSSTAWW